MPNGDDHLGRIRARIAKSPSEPGIYRWLGEDGAVLYVGKAKNLRNRLRSYVTAQGKSGPWKESMMRQVRDFDVTIVTSELEALFLETNLIKEHRPKYNVLMKDDKNYVYVKVTMQDPYPRIDIVRQIDNDGAKNFGPKTSAWEIREALTWLRQIFPFRTCRMGIETD